jgi:hypothetical protein
LVAIVAVVAAGFISCKFIASLSSFKPDAPMNEKWRKIAEWVPGGSSYFVMADIKRISETDFYKNVFADSSIRSLALLKGLDPDGGAGIVVGTGGLFFIGGKFDAKKVLTNIKSELDKQKMTLEQEKHLGKIIYSDKKGLSSFSFLEKYLVCFGNTDDIKHLIDAKKTGRLAQLDANPLQDLVARIGPGVKIYGKMTELDITATVSSTLNLKASGAFQSTEDAENFMTEAQGIKAIKTIESFDEPWLADVIDNIELKQSGQDVLMSMTMDPQAAKNILKKVLK